MKDSFALLGLPRRPHLSEEEISIAYLKLAGGIHPDQVGGDAVKFRELSEAAAILRDPARRLRELAGGTLGNQIPANAVELFSKIAVVLQKTDTLMKKHSLASNALTKALLSAPLKSLKLDLSETLILVKKWKDSLHQQLVLLDENCHLQDGFYLSQLADGFAYATRWERELRERELALDSILG